MKLLGENNALRLTNAPASDTVRPGPRTGNGLPFFARFQRRHLHCVGSGRRGAQTNHYYPIVSTPFYYSQLSWSPDGKWLAISVNAKDDRGIFLLPVEGGVPRQISTPKPPAYDRAPAFDLDGHRLAYSACNGASCDLYMQESGLCPFSPRQSAPGHGPGCCHLWA